MHRYQESDFTVFRLCNRWNGDERHSLSKGCIKTQSEYGVPASKPASIPNTSLPSKLTNMLVQILSNTHHDITSALLHHDANPQEIDAVQLE